MGNSIPAFAANAKIFVLIDSNVPKNQMTHARKTIYEIEDCTHVTSTIDSKDQSGGASVIFNDKDFRFWKYYPLSYLYTKQFNDRLTLNNKPVSRTKTEQKENAVYTNTNIQYSLRNQIEIEGFRDSLKKYKNQHVVYEALDALLDGEGVYDSLISKDKEKGGVLETLIDLQNLIWIFYMGRDGYWYPKFTGIVTNVKFDDPTETTPTIRLSAKPFTRLWEYSNLVTGLPNLGGIKSVSNLALPESYNEATETTKIAFNNYLATKKTAAEVIVETLNACNNFFLSAQFEPEISPVKGDEQISTVRDDSWDTRYFKVNDIFKIPTITSTSVNLEDTKGDVTFPESIPLTYPVDDKKWIPKKYWYEDIIPPYDLYNGTDVASFNPNGEKKWLSEVVMLKDFSLLFKPFQNLVRTNIQLGTLDTKTIKDILEVIKKTTLCCIYCDGDGSIKIERQNFDLSPWGDYKYVTETQAEQARKDANQQSDLPPEYDIRYIICKKDGSYLNSDFEKVESSIITRASTYMKQDLFNFEELTNKILMAGKAESSAKTYNKFGLREVVLEPIVRPEFLKSANPTQVMNSYAEAMKMILNSEANTGTVILDQRPDLHVNRNMYYLDKGLAFLITSLNEDLDFATGRHVTTARGEYVRPIGYPLINPFRFLVQYDAKNDKFFLKEWAEIPIDLFTKEKPLGEKPEIFGNSNLTSNETFDNIWNELIRYYNLTGGSDFDGDIQAKFDGGGVVSLLMINRPSREIGYLEGNDILYVLWKENGANQIAKYLCKAHPSHYKNNIEGWNKTTGNTYEDKTQLSSTVIDYVLGAETIYLGDNTVSDFFASKGTFLFEYLDKNWAYGTQYRNLQVESYFKGKHNILSQKAGLEKYQSYILGAMVDVYGKTDFIDKKLNNILWNGVNIYMNDTQIIDLASKIRNINQKDIRIVSSYVSLTEDKKISDEEKQKSQQYSTLVNLPAFDKLLITANFIAKGKDVSKVTSIAEYKQNNLESNPYGFKASNLIWYTTQHRGKIDKEFFQNIIVPDYKLFLESFINGIHNDAKSVNSNLLFKTFIRNIVEDVGIQRTETNGSFSFKYASNPVNSFLTDFRDRYGVFPVEHGYNNSYVGDTNKIAKNSYAAMLALLHLGVIGGAIDFGKGIGGLTEYEKVKILSYLASNYGLLFYSQSKYGVLTDIFVHSLNQEFQLTTSEAKSLLEGNYVFYYKTKPIENFYGLTFSSRYFMQGSNGMSSFLNIMWYLPTQDDELIYKAFFE